MHENVEMYLKWALLRAEAQIEEVPMPSLFNASYMQMWLTYSMLYHWFIIWPAVILQS